MREMNVGNLEANARGGKKEDSEGLRKRELITRLSFLSPFLHGPQTFYDCRYYIALFLLFCRSDYFLLFYIDQLISKKNTCRLSMRYWNIVDLVREWGWQKNVLHLCLFAFLSHFLGPSWTLLLGIIFYFFSSFVSIILTAIFKTTSKLWWPFT